MKNAKAFVLLSGGVDSTTCLYLARQQFDGNVEGISIHYGQRHAKEIEYAKKSCRRLTIKHTTLDISGVIPKTMLTDKTAEVPNISYAEIKGVSPTYVPFRNGLLLSAITSHVAGRYQAEVDPDTGKPEWGIYFGAHAEDAQNWAYPDCAPEWIGAMANAIFIGTYQTIRLHTPLEWLKKEEIVYLGQSLGVDWSLTWSCYKGEELHCGSCPTCRARRDGFRKAMVTDPTKYAKAIAA
jgi:7-cyano-7-deazaguanine synthase